MRVEFGKAERGGSYAVIDRPDGVRLRMSSYDRTSDVPHDLAHLVTERTLGLERGVWGSIAAGAVFGSMEVVSGRLRHDRHEPSRAVLKENRAELGMAELLSGVVHQGVGPDDRHVEREIRRAWQAFRVEPCPFPTASILGAVAELRELGAHWVDLAADATLVATWPVRSTSKASRRR